MTMKATRGLTPALALLDSIAGAYPSGIPRTAMAERSVVAHAAQSPAVAASGVKVLFAAMLADSALHEDDTDEDGVLLRAAVTSGMKLSLRDVAIVNCAQHAAQEASSRQLLSAIESSAPVCVVCLGAQSAALVLGGSTDTKWERGRWIQRGALLVLPSHDLATVRTDAGRKREFWEDLKLVLSLLNERGVSTGVAR